MAVKDCCLNRNKRLRLGGINSPSSRANQEPDYELVNANDTRSNEPVIPLFRDQSNDENNQSANVPDKVMELFDSFRNTNHLKELHCR